MARYLITDVNPEPWATGTLDVMYRTSPDGRRKAIPRMAPEPKLLTYQNALREEFNRLYPDIDSLEGDIEIEFHFWRSSAHGHPADATNLQKATEDALQGVLYGNDRTNRWVSSHIVAQGPAVRSAICIIIQPYEPPEIEEMEQEIAKRVPIGAFEDVDWAAPEEEMF
jgi:Holliday junction resolvase RusA-like endonuclease